MSIHDCIDCIYHAQLGARLGRVRDKARLVYTLQAMPNLHNVGIVNTIVGSIHKGT